MYNINKRTQFNTAGDLKKLLANIADETPISICGDSDCWFHIEMDESIICLDCEDLEECYEDYECQCPNGGDESNDCADCPYSCDYHFVNGECVRRGMEHTVCDRGGDNRYTQH